jgi:translocation and assembly module TamB
MKGLASFTIGREQLILTPLTLTSGVTEHIQLAADLAFKPLSGTFTAEWDDLNLARANSFLKEGNLSGSSGGKVHLDLSGTRMRLTGKVFSKAAYTGHGISIPLIHVQATIDGSEHGLIAGTEIVTAESGKATITISSPSPLGMTLPDKWKLSAELDDIDLALLKPWLPNHTAIKGHISGSAAGTFLPGRHFALNGNAVLSGGTFLLTRPEGQLNLSFTSAMASWDWRGETLAGALSLTMAEYGQARATFQLPVPAVFPPAVNRKGLLQASLIGKAEEKGIITTLFPAMIQESFGELDVDISLDGTWELPKISGTLKLARSGAYLPAAGIRLKDIKLTARLEQDLIRIDSFRAVSGPGHIEGTALITLKGRQVDGYRGAISGENFQIVHFPELRALSTPNLTFEGNLHKLILRGEVLLPEVQIDGASSRTVIEPSSDVIMEGRELPAPKGFSMVLDAQIRVLPGERVFIKMEGIDAQLAGAIDLSFDNLNSINSAGEIRVVKGRYRTYGVNLEIVRGRLFFAGGPMDSPTIDVLALRTIGDVRAGVTVTGTLKRPIIKLYSQPVMADVDILAYIVLGHPLGSKGQEASILAQAAGALLTSGQAADIQKKIKNYLGLSTFEIQSGEGGRATTTGYKPIQSHGAVAATRESGVAETILTVGKYLNPQVYVSYGKSLYSGSNLFRLRYDINKKWQIETHTGSESGADLFYKLEFR